MAGPPPPTWAVDPTAASATEVAPGVWRLRLPLGWVDVDHVNAYVVALDDGVMLVDCGSGGDLTCRQALEHAVRQSGHELADVRRLVLTHAHSDHAGLACTVQAESGAEIWSHPDVGHFYDVWRDAERIGALRASRALREGVPPSRVSAYADVREELTGADGVYTIDRPLSEGVNVPSALGDWEVLETPGHSPSHVALIQRDTGLLIAGDTVCVVFVPWMDYGCTPDPLAESLVSLDRLAAQPAVTLALPGHGRPLSDLPATVRLQRAGFEAELDALRNALSTPARGGYELTERIYGVEPDGPAVNHLNEVLGLLRYLRRRGEVSRVTDADRYIYDHVLRQEAE